MCPEKNILNDFVMQIEYTFHKSLDSMLTFISFEDVKNEKGKELKKLPFCLQFLQCAAWIYIYGTMLSHLLLSGGNRELMMYSALINEMIFQKYRTKFPSFLMTFSFFEPITSINSNSSHCRLEKLKSHWRNYEF